MKLELKLAAPNWVYKTKSYDITCKQIGYFRDLLSSEVEIKVRSTVWIEVGIPSIIGVNRVVER